MRTCVVTGASGFIGSALVERLLEVGWRVRAAARKPMRASPGLSVHRISDLAAEEDWEEILDGAEAVFHLAARAHVLREESADPRAAFTRTNVEGTIRIARAAARARARHFVYVSSIGVHGNSSAHRLKETDPPRPEEHYARSKLEAEDALKQIADEAGLSYTIVRPPLVYGPGNPGNFLKLLRLVERGLPLPLGSASNVRNMIYVGNLVDALILCAENPVARGKTYLVSDGEEVSTAELIRKIGSALRVRTRLIPVPVALLELAGKAAGKSREIEKLTQPLQVDSGEISRDLSWKPRFSVDQGIAATAAWFSSRESLSYK